MELRVMAQYFDSKTHASARHEEWSTLVSIGHVIATCKAFGLKARVADAENRGLGFVNRHGVFSPKKP